MTELQHKDKIIDFWLEVKNYQILA
jgi:hypothetical protein